MRPASALPTPRPHSYTAPSGGGVWAAPTYGSRREPNLNLPRPHSAPILHTPEDPGAPRAGEASHRGEGGFDVPLYPVGCEAGTHCSGTSQCAPLTGRVVPQIHPLVASATLFTQQSGWSDMVRGESCGEWPAQHAEGPVQ